MDYLPGESYNYNSRSSKATPRRRNLDSDSRYPRITGGSMSSISSSGGGGSNSRRSRNHSRTLSQEVIPSSTSTSLPQGRTRTTRRRTGAAPTPQEHPSASPPPPYSLHPHADETTANSDDPGRDTDSIAQHLTSTTFSALTTHLNTTYLTPALTHLRSAYIDPYLIRPAAGYLANSSAAGAGGSSPAMPDLVSVVLLVAILFISLKVLDYARRVVMFWVGLLWALIWWGTIVGLVLWVYLHGVERAAQDAGWLFGIARGFLGRMIEQVERRGEYYQQPQRGADGGGVFGMGGMGGRAQQAPLGRW